MHICHFPDFIMRAFPEIQPMSSFFSDFKKDSVSSLSCQMGTPAVNSSKFDCDIRVSNGNPTFHPDIQSPSTTLDSEFKKNAQASRPHRGATVAAKSSKTPSCFCSWQPARTVCQEPLGTCSPFQDPVFKQIKVLSSCWWKPEVQVEVNECGILKAAGRTSKDWVGPESFL